MQWGYVWGSHLAVLVWLNSCALEVCVCCVGLQDLGWKRTPFIWTADADFLAARTQKHCKRFPNCFPPSLLRLSIRRMRKTCLSIRIFEVQFVLRMLLSSWSLWLVVHCDVIPCRLWGFKFWLVGKWFLKHDQTFGFPPGRRAQHRFWSWAVFTCLCMTSVSASFRCFRDTWTPWQYQPFKPSQQWCTSLQLQR